MTRGEYSRTLRYMERLRMDSYEAETPAEERRMDREYGRLAKSIEPYALGTKEFDPPLSATTDASTKGDGNG